MEEKIYRWGMIGCGSVTNLKSAPAYQKTEHFELSAVMSRSLDKAQAYARQRSIGQVYASAADLIFAPDIDAIYIATPPDTHEHYALMVAQAGKICCIEKPMAPDYKACQRINRAFEEKNLPLFVAYYRRSLPRFLKIKEWLDQDKIGKVSKVHWHFTKAPNEMDRSGAYNWRTDNSIARGGYFDDLASHGLDLLAYYFGPFSAVQGSGKNILGLYSAYDRVSAQWQHESGVRGSGTWDFTAQDREDQVVIEGHKGQIRFSVFREDPIILETGQKTEVLQIEHPEHVQWYHVQNIKSHLEGIAQHPSTGKTAAHTAWAMEEILK